MRSHVVGPNVLCYHVWTSKYGEDYWLEWTEFDPGFERRVRSHVAAPSVLCPVCQSMSTERSTVPVDLNALHSFCSIVCAAVCSTKRVLSELFNSESRDPMYHVNALHSCNKIIALFINKCTSTSAKLLMLKTRIGKILLWFGAICQKKGNVHQLCIAFDTKLS